jgi:transcriptional regulator with XRE-family HTH domain
MRTGRPRLDKYRDQGAALRGCRTSLGLSQLAFAQLLGVTKQHVHSVERGTTPVSALHALALLGLLACARQLGPAKS